MENIFLMKKLGETKKYKEGSYERAVKGKRCGSAGK